MLIILTSLHRSPFFAQPAIYVFTQNMIHKLHPVNWSAAAKNRRWRRFTRTYAHTDIIKHQLKVYSTHVCPSVLEAPCSHPKSCTRCAYVSKKCDIASTPLPWQCLPCESADPCCMVAGSTQNAYTTRPLSPEDETGPARQMGSSFQSKVCSDLQGTKQSSISY